MNTKDKIKKALDRNILVYDADSRTGVLTLRLLKLIRAVMRQNDMYFDEESESIIDSKSIENGQSYRVLASKCNLHTILVNGTIELDNDVIDELTLDFNNKRVRVEFTDFDLNEYFKSLGGSLARDDTETIMAIADISRLGQPFQEEYLLGSC